MYLENNKIHRYPIRAIFSWTLVVIWMALIFALSHQTGEESGLLSQKIIKGIFQTLSINASQELVTRIEGIVRSIAHGTVFFILALLTAQAFAQITARDIRNAILTFCVCILYAASDELHQAFVPGRASQLADFLIDGLGIILAIILYQLISTLRFLRADLRVKREEDLRI